MDDAARDPQLRQTAFNHVNRLANLRDGMLDSADLASGFEFGGERIPLINPQRGIFKPRQMEHLLSIKTVFPRRGARVWYDDQREVHPATCPRTDGQVVCVPPVLRPGFPQGFMATCKGVSNLKCKNNKSDSIYSDTMIRVHDDPDRRVQFADH